MDSSKLGPRTMRVMSHLTDENDVTIVRPVPRRDRLIKLGSAWSVDDVSHSAGSADSVMDASFAAGLLSGVTLRPPQRASVVLRHRLPATMRDASELNNPSMVLPRNAGAVRLRQEHLQQLTIGQVNCSNTTIPFPRWERVNITSNKALISIARNAFGDEMRDVHHILRSMETRRFDLCAADIQALFAFLKPLENAMRVYLAASERAVYTASIVLTRCARTATLWDAATRRGVKRRVVGHCDRVEMLRRPMLAHTENARRLLGELQSRVQALATGLMELLDMEIEQVEKELDEELTMEQRDNMARGLLREVRGTKLGKDVILLLSRGVDGGRAERENWVRGWVKGTGRIGTGFALARFADRHTRFVEMFEEAEREYRALYGTTG